MDTMSITGSTRLMGVIGHPIANSESPAIHNAVFRKLGYDYAYVALDVERDNLEAAVRGMEALGFLGYNVATPYKKAIVPYLHEVSQVAQIMGAVNTVAILDGRSLGDNADGAAFMRNLVLNGVSVVGKKITILGAGGVASAIAVQAALDGVAQIDVFNRNDKCLAQYRQVIARLKQHSDCQVELHPLSDTARLRESLQQSALMVNATSVGSYAQPGCLIEEGVLPEGVVVADMVYTPRETELIAMARKNGNRVLDGVGPFVQQAAIAERLWCGCSLPVDYVTETFFGE